jgi:hypothetical protein
MINPLIWEAGECFGGGMVTGNPFTPRTESAPVLIRGWLPWKNYKLDPLLMEDHYRFEFFHGASSVTQPSRDSGTAKLSTLKQVEQNCKRFVRDQSEYANPVDHFQSRMKKNRKNPVIREHSDYVPVPLLSQVKLSRFI